MGISMRIEVDGEEHEVPARHVVCATCEGVGRVMLASLRGVAFTEEDRDQMSPEELDDMAEGAQGPLGETCPTCKGDRVTLEPLPARGSVGAVIAKWRRETVEAKASLKEWHDEIETQFKMGGGW